MGYVYADIFRSGVRFRDRFEGCSAGLLSQNETQAQNQDLGTTSHQSMVQTETSIA